MLDAPIFNELKQIVLKTVGVTDLLRAGLEPLLPRLEQAFIYGSLAKGEDHVSSDIDVMLVGTDLNYSEVMQILEPIESQLQRSVNPTLYSPAEFAKRLARWAEFFKQGNGTNSD